jgi:hypothetical protein
VDNSYPTPALCDAISERDLRNAYARLYRHADNLAMLVAALRAARDEWPGERVEYLVADDRLDVIDEAMRKP